MQPLIFTTKGNIPLDSVTQVVEWRVSPDQIIFIEKYFLGEELVKESTHVKILTGVTMTGEAST